MHTQVFFTVFPETDCHFSETVATPKKSPWTVYKLFDRFFHSITLFQITIKSKENINQTGNPDRDVVAEETPGLQKR